MAVYYQGCGPRDTCNTMSLLGVPGGKFFHNIFYKNIDSFTKDLTNELQLIIDEGLRLEIKATINHLLKDEYSVEEIEEYIEGFKDG